MIFLLSICSLVAMFADIIHLIRLLLLLLIIALLLQTNRHGVVQRVPLSMTPLLMAVWPAEGYYNLDLTSQGGPCAKPLLILLLADLMPCSICQVRCVEHG